MSQKYKLRYTLKPECGQFEPDEVNDDQGLCDAFCFVSIVKPESGGYSQMLLHLDGATEKPLTQKDLFKLWSMIGMSLSDNNELKGYQKDLVDGHAEFMRNLMKKADNEN